MDVYNLHTTTATIAADHNREHIDLLRREAEVLEASAKRLRDLAFALENGSEIDTVGPYETAPLDEHGVPKYRGKKRGRKPKKRLRKKNPYAKKRAHTAYTLFVQSTYPKIKEQHEAHQATSQDDQNSFQSKNIISIVAKQWQDIPENQKEEWRRRAKEATKADQIEDDIASVDDAAAAVVVHHQQEEDLNGHANDASETVADVVTRLSDHNHLPAAIGHHELQHHGHDHDQVNLENEQVVEDAEAAAAAYDITAEDLRA